MCDRRRRAPWRGLGFVAAFGVLVGSCVTAASHIDFSSPNNVGFPFESSDLPPAPPPADFGSAKEVGTRGDKANPRAVYHGAFPSDGDTQERTIGGAPARFSGYTTWIRSVSRAPAHRYVDGYGGSYLRLHVTVFNRDTDEQHVCACDFFVWTHDHGLREADAVGAPVVARFAEMPSGARRDGDVYLYVGHVPPPYFVIFNPDSHV